MNASLILFAPTISKTKFHRQLLICTDVPTRLLEVFLDTEPRFCYFEDWKVY